MHIRYVLNGVSPKNKMLCIGDLIRYYGEAKYKTQEKLNKIRYNHGLSSMLLNSMRKHPGMSGMTIESLISSLEASASMDIFTFDVDGKSISKMIDADSHNMILEVDMNPLFFSTKASLTMYTPTIGKKRSFEEMEAREKENWIRWFEKELNNYCSASNWKKTIVEE
jgi:hypothetical protein